METYDVERRLHRDAASFQAEIARLDHEGTLRRTLLYLGLAEDEDECGRRDSNPQGPEPTGV